MKRGLVLSLCVVLPVLALNAPAASARTEAGSAGTQPLGVKLANQVLNKKKLARSVKAAQQVLALSGIATVREGQEIVPGVAPLSRWKMTARETVLLAQGAGTPVVSLGQIARRMSESGVKIGSDPWTRLMPEIVQEWSFESTLYADENLSQPAHFIQQMQARQSSRVPLYKRLENPSKMTLSALEALVLMANIERVVKPGEAPAPAPEPDEQYEEDYEDEYYEEEPVTASASQASPCGQVKEAIKSLGPDAEAEISFVIGEESGRALGKVADRLRPGGKDGLGKLTTALDIIDRVVRTTAFALNVQVIVEPAMVRGDKIDIIEDRRVHKRTDGSRKHVWFFAGVGLDDFARQALKGQLELAKEDWFQNAMRQCAELHGITIPKVPYGDLAAEMTDWKATWKPNWRTDEVRTYHPYFGQLKRLDDTSAYSLFKVGVDWEKPKYHNSRRGVQVTSDWTARVDISAQKAPSPQNMVKLAIAIGTFGAESQYADFAGPIAELMEGMYRTIAKPTGTGTLTVEEHVKNPCWDDDADGASASC